MSKQNYIPYGRQLIDEDDIAEVVRTLRSPYLTTGPKVKEFEEAIAQYVGAKDAVAFSSGTAALHGAFWAGGLGAGDEVLVPTFSFLATANAAVYVGAKPIFVDSLPGAFNIDPADARRKITAKTKAIVPVHFAGQPADMEAIYALAKEFKLLVIEDAAHALGASYGGKKIGGLTQSAMTVFSFHPVKQITTAEGGMVTTQDPALAKRLRQFRHHGIDVSVTERDAKQQWSYDMTELGFNYRLSDLHCALGLSQLKKCESFLNTRQKIAAAYDKAFKGVEGITTPPRERANDRHSWHLYIVQLDPKKVSLSRDEAFAKLRASGIGVHVHYRPIHLHSFYRARGYKPETCPNIESLFPKLLTLPIHPAMNDADITRVTQGLIGLTHREAIHEH
jgi:perosamine synthetase